MQSWHCKSTCELYAIKRQRAATTPLTRKILHRRPWPHTARHKLLNKRKYANVSTSRGPRDHGCSSLNGIIRHAVGSAAICNPTMHAPALGADASSAEAVHASVGLRQRRKRIIKKGTLAQTEARLIKVAISNNSRYCSKICSMQAADLAGPKNCRAKLTTTQKPNKERQWHHPSSIR